MCLNWNTTARKEKSSIFSSSTITHSCHVAQNSTYQLHSRKIFSIVNTKNNTNPSVLFCSETMIFMFSHKQKYQKRNTKHTTRTWSEKKNYDEIIIRRNGLHWTRTTLFFLCLKCSSAIYVELYRRIDSVFCNKKINGKNEKWLCIHSMICGFIIFVLHMIVSSSLLLSLLKSKQNSDRVPCKRFEEAVSRCHHHRKI